jgi:hypothetical protein
LLRGEWVEGRTRREQAKAHARIGGGSTVAPKGHASGERADLLKLDVLR